MNRMKQFYPDESAIKVLNEIIEEVYLIMHYPFRTLEKSRFHNVDVENDMIPFIELYEPEFKRGILLNFLVTEPVMPPFINKIIQNRQVRAEKKRIYQKLEPMISEINELILTELWSDRKKLLMLAKRVLIRVTQEVKSDLME